VSGDEGKGKIIDVLTEQADVVVRYQAATTRAIQSSWRPEYVLHLIRRGIHGIPGKISVIGNGVVVDPVCAAWRESNTCVDVV